MRERSVLLVRRLSLFLRIVWRMYEGGRMTVRCSWDVAMAMYPARRADASPARNPAVVSLIVAAPKLAELLERTAAAIRAADVDAELSEVGEPGLVEEIRAALVEAGWIEEGA